jgi:integrase
MPKITKRVVDATGPQTKVAYVWDEVLRGFGLRIMPSGRKSYVVFYRNDHGRQRWYTIGQHGVFTPDQAREDARQILQEARRGHDPAADRKLRRGALDMNALLDRYLNEHVESRNKKSTQAEVRRLVEKHIRPELGKFKVGDIVAVARVGRGLAAAAANPRIEKSAIDAVRLLALTGCRLSEILTLRWDYVDRQRGGFALPDSKTGQRFVPVGNIVLDLLDSSQANSTSEWVIAHRDPSKHLAKERVEKAWQRIRASIGLEDVRLHDFRHTVGTYAAGAGASAFLIRDKLGHSQVATTDRYVNFDISPTRALSDLIESKIAAALATMPNSRETVEPRIVAPKSAKM